MTFKFLTQTDSGLPLLSDEKYLPVVDVTVIVWNTGKVIIRYENISVQNCIERGRVLTSTKTPLPNVCYPVEFVRSRSSGMSVITKIHRKIFDSSLSAFQGYWNQHWSIGYLRLPVSDR